VSRFAAALLAASTLGIVWAVLIAATGGFDADLFGVRLRSHNAVRPLLAALAIFALAVLVYGPRGVLRQLTPMLRAAREGTGGITIHGRWIVAVLATGVCLFGLVRGTGVAGGADTYGYISQADLWRRGLPIVPQPWAAEVPWPGRERTFEPLGYRVREDGGALVPVYAAGLPLLMAGAKLLGGHSAIFWLTPLAGAALVVVTYLVGRRLGSSRAGLVGAFLVATNVTLLAEVTVPMSDVIAAAALSGAMCLLLRETPGALAGAGVLAGLAVLVRPNLAPTVGVMAAWLALRRSHGSPWGPIRIGRAAVFALAASPGFAVPAWANWRLYGSPLRSGYGTAETIYDWSNVLPNLERYAEMLVQSHQAVAFAGLAALALPVRRLWPRVQDRSVFAGIAVFVFSIVAQYVAYEPALGEGYLRFLLPLWPFVMVGAARVFSELSRRRWMTVAVALGILVYTVVGVQRLCAKGTCDPRRERRYAQVAQLVRERTEPTAVIYTFHHSGSMRYYGGRLTLRYDLLDRGWLDRSVEWFASRGIHAYLAVDEWEIEGFRGRFAGEQRISQLDVPFFTYRGTVRTLVFDLLRPPEYRGSPELIIDRFDGPRYPRPAPEGFPVPRFGR
jgi:hypothetical protein